ncbi:hypothetical protein G6F57_016420 [Rhizopus arrhizus]|nr:hypothetical protein G6F57_016420 [Rhizopus arrhizus]
MVEADRADGVEVAQVVLVRRVRAVPGHDVQRRMVDRCAPQAAFELGDQLEVTVHVLECRMRGLEVAWVGQAVGADRAEVGQLQQRAVVLADVAAARAVGQFHPEAHATRDHRDLLRLDLDHAHLGQQAQRAQLGHDQQLAIGVVEIAADHVAVGRVQMDAHTRVRIGRTVATHGVQAFDEVGRQLRQRQRAPAQLVRRGRLCAEITLQLRLRERGELAVGDRRAYPVQPAAAIAAARRGKRGAGQLFGVQAVGHLLRRVLPDRQCTGHGLGGEFVAETGLVAAGGEGGGHGNSRDCRPAAGTTMWTGKSGGRPTFPADRTTRRGGSGRTRCYRTAR